jgi:hypothetical protein
MNAAAVLCERGVSGFTWTGGSARSALAENVRRSSGIERADLLRRSAQMDAHPLGWASLSAREAHATRSRCPLISAETRGLAGHHQFSDYGLCFHASSSSKSVMSIKAWTGPLREMARNVGGAYFGQWWRGTHAELMAVGLDIVLRFNGRLDTSAPMRSTRNRCSCTSRIAAPSYTTLNDRYCLRIANSNHRSTLEDFDLLAREVVRLGKEISARA